MNLEEAIKILSAIPEYDWLVHGRQFYTTADIYSNTGISVNTVRGWKDDVAGATDYGDKLGVRFPRSGLIIFFAERVRRAQQGA